MPKRMFTSLFLGSMMILGVSVAQAGDMMNHDMEHQHQAMHNMDGKMSDDRMNKMDKGMREKKMADDSMAEKRMDMMKDDDMDKKTMMRDDGMKKVDKDMHDGKTMMKPMHEH